MLRSQEGLVRFVMWVLGSNPNSYAPPASKHPYWVSQRLSNFEPILGIKFSERSKRNGDVLVLNRFQLCMGIWRGNNCSKEVDINVSFVFFQISAGSLRPISDHLHPIYSLATFHQFD